MIKINKELECSDGVAVPSGSVVTYDFRFLLKESIIVFDLKLYLSLEALTSGKRTISDVIGFKLRLSKECTKEECDNLNSSDDSTALMEGWLQELIDLEIGKGFTEIV